MLSPFPSTNCTKDSCGITNYLRYRIPILSRNSDPATEAIGVSVAVDAAASGMNGGGPKGARAAGDEAACTAAAPAPIAYAMIVSANAAAARLEIDFLMAVCRGP